MKWLDDNERGKIRLTTSYNTEKQLFVVSVSKATNLLPFSSKGVCDSYVKWYVEVSLEDLLLKKCFCKPL